MATTLDKVTYQVLLGAAGGAAPDPATDVVTYLRPVKIARYQGGRRLDNAEFVYDLSVTGERIENLRTPTGFARQVEVRVDLGGGDYTPVFWGDVTGQRITVGQGEGVSVTASVFPYHFGAVLRGPLVYDPLSAAERTLNEDVTLNPQIDGVIEGNRSTRIVSSGKHYYWGDPESFRTSAAETYQGESLSRWTLALAVEAIVWACNPDQTFVANPSQISLDPVWSGAEEPLNERFPRGKYLPYYLDALLPKYGYNWCLDLAKIDDGAGGFTTKPTLRFFKIGDGTQKTVRLQPYGEALELDAAALSYTNLLDADVATDVGNVANAIALDGAHKEREVTIELYRGWAEADDALTETDLAISDGDSDYHGGKSDVWRLWVANEAGDYCSSRTTVAPIPAAPRDWSTLGVEVPRRRRILDCLTLGDDGKRRPPYLEWISGEASSSGSGEAWQPVPPEWTYTIYETQMAIRFSGDTPPPELILAGDDARLRVTCSLVADERITAAANASGDSPNGRDATLFVDASDRFAFREVVTTGDYASAINDGTADADTRDDSTALQAFAEYLRSNTQSADMAGRFTLFGIDHTFQIGDLLTKIAGREISLDRNSEAAATPAYLQVVGVEWDEQRQTTTLVASPTPPGPAPRREAGGAT